MILLTRIGRLARTSSKFQGILLSDFSFTLNFCFPFCKGPTPKESKQLKDTPPQPGVLFLSTGLSFPFLFCDKQT